MADWCLGAKTFFAFCHPNDQCGANGLPLTPNSIRIQGRFQQLKTLRHPNLCQYMDIARSKHERLIVVGEHYVTSLRQAVQDGVYKSEDAFVSLAHQCLLALHHLHRNGYTHRNLNPDNILVTITGLVKLSDYGLYHMTNSGRDVAFPIGTLKYLPPEVLAERPVYCTQADDSVLTGPKADVWSLGLILLEVYVGCEIWSTMTLQQMTRKLLGLLTSDISPLRELTQELSDQSRLESMPEHLSQFLGQCLTVRPSGRSTAGQLLELSLFAQLEKPVIKPVDLITNRVRCLDLKLEDIKDQICDTSAESVLRSRDLSEVYYLWCLFGGTLETVLRRESLIKARPPVTMMPGFVLDTGEPFGARKDSSSLHDASTVLLSLDQLLERIAGMDDEALWPLLEGEVAPPPSKQLSSSPSCASLQETANLPSVIKERDIEYQFHRMLLYHRLLLGYPSKRPRIWTEARMDVPPYWRAHVWAAILEVEGDYQEKYQAIDKESAISTDRQIEVDIPRCHQYDELLSSPSGHSKLKRVLKAWVVTHPQYVYWQGLDSLTAPFLSLNFNDEALAFACLTKFIPKYLNKFFLKDNSKVIQEYLCVFAHLIAFHDPELSSHLDGIGFIPDLYAIPWFLTMYAHVFPLYKIYHLWDTLILGNSSYPLCIGVAILQQLKLHHNLMTFGFNECILLFSDMPQIDIDRCVSDSIKIFCNTPKSSTYRQYVRPLIVRRQFSERTSTKLHSYYSQDYNELPANPLSMDPVSIEDLRLEKCPRISAEDMIELCELRRPSPSRTPAKRSKTGKPRIVVIDIRSPDDYNRGTIPGSLNIPYTSAFNSEGDLIPISAVHSLNQYRCLVKVIFGGRGKNVVYFANELVRLGYQKVCILHRGIDVMYQTGLLTVPNV